MPLISNKSKCPHAWFDGKPKAIAWRIRRGFRLAVKRGQVAVFCGLTVLVGISAVADDATIRFDFSPLAEVLPMDERSAVAVIGDGMKVAIDRPFARPQDRYVEVLVDVADGDALIKASLRDALSGDGLFEKTATPKARRGRLLIDMRRLSRKEVEFTLELVKGRDAKAIARTILYAKTPDEPLRTGQRVRIGLDVPDGVESLHAWPVTFGVPFPAGTLWDIDRVRLVDADGRPLPCQKETTGLWAEDGAIQWIRFDTLVSHPGGCYVELTDDAGAQSKVDQSVEVVAADHRVTVRVAGAEYVLAKGVSPIRSISHKGRVVASADGGARGLYAVDNRGRLGQAVADGETMTVEASGPVTASVRFEGDYATREGERLARHVTRLEFFAGQPSVQVTHTFVLTCNTNELWFRDIGWHLNVEPGEEAKAMFATSRTDWQMSFETDVRRSEAVYLLQDDYIQFGGGKDHFAIASETESRDGQKKTLLEGAECGDWAAMRGDAGGLMISCRDTARQHPKEYRFATNQMDFKLFSSLADEELDFRPAVLARRWNRGGKLTGEYAESAKTLETNAVGWSKTHEFLLRPVAPTETDDTLARLSRLHSTPVLGLADPKWIHESRAMGPLHPKDTERFREAEELIEAAFDNYYNTIHSINEYGFVDYWAGPHYSGFPSRHRYRLSYTIRNDAWLLYARSGERKIYEFARNSTRTFQDNIMAQWDGPDRIRGLFTSSGGSAYDSLPYYWERTTNPEFSTDTTLGHMLCAYRLCGYRRGRDGVLEYVDGLKRWWNGPYSEFRRTWRPIMLARCLLQSYTLTWDEDLRVMLNAVTNFLYDPETTVALTKDRPYNSPTYKTQTDVSTLIRLWQQFGTPRLYEMAYGVSDYWYRRSVGRSTNSRLQRGIVGDFLFVQTGDPRVAQWLALGIRQEAGEPINTGVSHAVARFQGIPYSQSVVVRTDADRKPLASWAGFEDFGYPVSFVLQKGKQDSIDSRVNVSQPGDVGARLTVRPVQPSTSLGLGGIQVDEEMGGSVRVLLPKDADGGAYEIRFSEPSSAAVMANGRFPLVVYAPEYFRPFPKIQNPFTPIYFQVPEGENDGRIFFEGSARLFDPDGEPYLDGAELQGWVKLPADKPGLWSFQPLKNWLVCVRNLPPFFAFDDPSSYFDPAIPWHRVDEQAFDEPPEEAEYVTGVSETETDRALNLCGARTLTLEPGPPHPSGDGGRFLPFKQGTIEFYIRPYWNTFDLWPRGRKVLIRMPADEQDWILQYAVYPENERWPPMRSLYSHVLRGSFVTTEPGRNNRFYGCRRLIVEAGNWIHVAWVWGQREIIGAHRDVQRIVTTRTFVNGKLGTNYHYPYRDAWPKHAPRQLLIGDGLNAAIDKLRISDVIRYNADFTPPSVETHLRVDEHTRAAFEFDGSLSGRSHDYDGPLPVNLTE